MPVLQVVDRPRHSLVVHARFLRDALHSRGLSSTVLVNRTVLAECPGSFPFSVIGVWQRSKVGDVIIFWSLGLSVLCAPLLRIAGRRTVLVYHEPSTLKERVKKTGQWSKAMVSSLVLAALVPTFSRLVTPNRANAARLGVPYARLPIAPPPTDVPKHRTGLKVVFLGARLSTRSVDLFEMARTSLSGKAEFRYFPDGNDRTEAAKRCLLSSSGCVVWNLFRVPYNQSGVTLDALSCGVPILITEMEPLGDLLVDKGAAIRLRSEELTLESIAWALDSIEKNYERMSMASRVLGARWSDLESTSLEWIEAIGV
jgi:hypothetical protein